MRTKRTKAANIRIGDVLYGIGTVESIVHLSRTEVDIHTVTDDRMFTDRITRDMDDLVEVVTSSTNPLVVLP